MRIVEHFITVWNTDKTEKEKYIDDVWNILEKTYSKIGGLKIFNKKEDLLKTTTLWKLVSRNNKINAVAIYKTARGGRKLVAGGSDGTTQGKNDFYTICYEDVNRIERGAYAEVSGALEYIYLFKYGGVPIPVNITEKIVNDMGRDILSKNPDGFHYTREIGNESIEKIMFGNVPEQYRTTTDWESESNIYRSIFDNQHPEALKLRIPNHRKKK